MIRSGPVPIPAGLGALVAAFEYDTVRGVVVALKYRNARRVLPWAAAQVAALAHRPVDLVTWPPTTRRRLADRGFDQAERLARGVACRLRRPCRNLLVREDGGAQTGRRRSERLAAPSFSLRSRVGGRVLLVDDVVTTGATVSAAARALLDGGAADVLGVVLAHTSRAGARVRVAAA